jgi:hypothetical protein
MIKELTVATMYGDPSGPLTIKNLQEFADTCIDRLVVVGFDQSEPVGIIKSAKINGETLVVTTNIADRFVPSIIGMYGVIGFVSDVIHKDDYKFHVAGVKALCVGITGYPIDKTLPKIK